MLKAHNSTFNIQNSKIIMGITLGKRIHTTMRPVRGNSKKNFT